MKIENFRDFFTTPRHKCVSCSFFKKKSLKKLKNTHLCMYMYIYMYIQLHPIYIHVWKEPWCHIVMTLLSYHCNNGSPCKLDGYPWCPLNPWPLKRLRKTKVQVDLISSNLIFMEPLTVETEIPANQKPFISIHFFKAKKKQTSFFQFAICGHLLPMCSSLLIGTNAHPGCVICSSRFAQRNLPLKTNG